MPVLLFDCLNLLDFPESIKDGSKIGLVLPHFQEDVRFPSPSEVAATEILVVLGMYEIDYVVIFNVLLVGLHLKLIMNSQLKDPFWDIFIDDQEPTGDRERHNCLRTVLFSIFIALFIFLI